MADDALPTAANVDWRGTSSTLPPAGVEYVVGVKMHRNYLAHLAVYEGVETWASRYVTTLCGLPLLAVHTSPEAHSHRDPDGVRVARRHCSRCERKAGLA